MRELDPKRKTQRDLIPPGMCPSLVMKHLLTHSMDEIVYDDRALPGDGYYWCLRTCRSIGPDDEHVRPDRCLPGRGCYDGPQG